MPSPHGGSQHQLDLLTPLAEEVLAKSASNGWSEVRLSAAETIRGGEENWRRFVEQATPDRLTRARDALEGAT